MKRLWRAAVRTWRRSASWFWSRLAHTAETAEHRYAKQLRDQITDLKRTNDQLVSDVTLRDRQIQQLTEVISRDRERIAKETAIFARQKQEAIVAPANPHPPEPFE